MSGVTFKKLLSAAELCRQDFVSLGRNVDKLDKTKSYSNLAKHVQGLQKSDFGIDNQFFKNQKIDIYSSSTLFETKSCEIQFGLFLLPKGYYIAMHDHPSMFVITKILHGTARKLSYSLSDKTQQKHQFLFPQQVHQMKNRGVQSFNHLEKPKIQVEKQFDNVVSEGILDVVRPHEGNLHAFYASEDQDFVFLNCFIPHYDDKTRFTNFYEIEEEGADQTQAIMQYGAPEGYEKQVRQFDCEEMPFFSDSLPFFQGNKDCLLEDFLLRTDYQNRHQNYEIQQQQRQQRLQKEQQNIQNQQQQFSQQQSI